MNEEENIKTNNPLFDSIENKTSIIPSLDKLLSDNKLTIGDKDLVLTRCFNEAWFSNTLAWLLDHNGSHRLGVSFANKFLRAIATSRSDTSSVSIQCRSHLKFGKAGEGKGSTNLSLANTSVLREFYLAPSISKKDARGSRYCDIVFIDPRSFCLVIENKLFSSNHTGQLTEYFELIEDSFQDEKIREYVYLTLYGEPPHQQSENPEKLVHWVSLSWTKDILDIVNSEYKNPKKKHREVKQLRQILKWLSSIKNSELEKTANEYRSLLLHSSAFCLLEELDRREKGKCYAWKVQEVSSNCVKLFHTSQHKTSHNKYNKLLYIEQLQNLSTTIQVKNNKGYLSEKIIIPYGIGADQTYQLLDVAAREIYKVYFNNINLHLGNSRIKKNHNTENKNKTRDIFNYTHKKQNELKTILMISRLNSDS